MFEEAEIKERNLIHRIAVLTILRVGVFVSDFNELAAMANILAALVFVIVAIRAGHATFLKHQA